MNTKPTIAVSIGDINGVGLAIACLCHKKLSSDFNIIYCGNKQSIADGMSVLKFKMPSDFDIAHTNTYSNVSPGILDHASGLASFEAFEMACYLADAQEVNAIVTLPINKLAWSLAGIDYVGHTEYLRDRYKQDAIMMLGCDKMFVGLYTDHVSLKQALKLINSKKIAEFLINFAQYNNACKIAVLGINPHAGDGGVIGNEDTKIEKAIFTANKYFNKQIFFGPFPPDTAFCPSMRKEYTFFASMTHDHGLSALKALYFEESINVSLGLPITRASVDHGTAFNIAYKIKPSISSYLEAFKYVNKHLSLNRVQ